MEGDRRRKKDYESLRKRRDFDRIFREGIRYRGQRINVHIMRSSGEGSRLGIVVTRKTGGAVRRNRFKRLVREAFRQEAGRMTEPWDVVVVVHPRADEGLGPIAKEVAAALERHRGAISGTA